MKEFIAFTDIHYSMNPSKSYTRSDGMNSWLYEQIQVTDQIFDYAKKHKINTVIHNGDLFEDKSRINVVLYNIIWNLYKEYSKKFNIIFNTGNHDIVSIDGNSSLAPFSDIVTVIKDPATFEDEHNVLRMIPYGMVTSGLLKCINDKKHILFIHEDIIGLVYSGSEFIRSKIRFDSKPFKDWNIVFNGHIHGAQEIKNIINIGSPIPRDWNDSSDNRRFIHYNGEVNYIPIDTIKFIEVDSINKVPKNDSRNFYRVNISSEESDNEIFKRLNVSYNVTKHKRRENRIKNTLSDLDTLKSYIEMLDTKLDKGRLIEIGKELITE